MFKDNLSVAFPYAEWGQRKQTGQFGVELELEGEGIAPFDIAGWAVHAEGSLRNGGVEFVTNSAVTRDQLTFRLRELNKTLEANSVRLNYDTYRTSTHIHLNIQGENLGFLLGVSTVFAIVEPLFLRLCGKTRDGNHFCLSGVDSGDWETLADDIIQFIGYKGQGARIGRGKYSSLNFTRVTELGTVEFRSFPMSVSSDQILGWCSWIERISGLARASTDPMYRGYIKQAQRDPIGFAQSVFGYRIDCPEQDIRDLILLGCQGAYEISRAIKQRITLDEREERNKSEGKKVRARRNDGEWRV